MAKQTFTTGQVLTAAQMTSLQQTAMGGGSPIQKTASYVLAADDAGTVIQMNSASSTTITVNTALFSAGDSVQIQNIGAGVCTVTAGTATVTTAGSLALTQWEGGTLYFTSASAAIFFDIVQSGGMTNPMNTSGDTIYGGASGTPTRLGIGSTGNVLTVSGGIPSWAAPAAGGGMTLLNSGGTALSGTTTTISTISGSYNDLVIYVVDYYASSDFGLYCLINGDTTGANYQQFVNRGTGSSNNAFVDNSTGGVDCTGYAAKSADNDNFTYIYIPNYANTVSKKVVNSISGFIQATGSAKAVCNNNTYYAGTTAAVTSLGFKTTVGTWSGGTVYVYGVK